MTRSHGYLLHPAERPRNCSFTKAASGRSGVVRNGIVRHVDALNALKAHHLVSGLRTRTERQAATKATAKTAVWTVEKPEGGKDFVGVDR